MFVRRVQRLTWLALLAAAICPAQQDNASILGTVSDSLGAVVPSAQVSIQNQATAQAVNLSTDGNGNFFAPVLPVGRYRITVTVAGFKTQALDDITLRVADRLRVNVTLEPGGVQETVTVTGAAPLVDTASTTLGGVVGEQQLGELPLNGRDLSALLTIIPGVTLLGGATQQSVNGSGLFRQEGGMRFLL